MRVAPLPRVTKVRIARDPEPRPLLQSLSCVFTELKAIKIYKILEIKKKKQKMNVDFDFLFPANQLYT